MPDLWVGAQPDLHLHFGGQNEAGKAVLAYAPSDMAILPMILHFALATTGTRHMRQDTAR